MVLNASFIVGSKRENISSLDPQVEGLFLLSTFLWFGENI